MKWLRGLASRIVGLFRSEERGREFAEELESHLQMHIDDNLRLGMPPAEARRQAILKLGGVEQAKEAYRDRVSLPWVETLRHDLRFTFRQLLKNPGFALGAILVLTIGIGVSGAIFAFVDAALIKPLPYRDPSRLAFVTESAGIMPAANLSYQDYLDWKSRNQVFQSLEVWNDNSYLLRTASGPEPVPGVRVSDGFFRTLGIQPILGRDFYAGEDLPSGPFSVLLSYATWQRRYAGSRNVINQTVTLNGDVYTIIGVLPPEFQFSPRGNAEFWTALHPTDGCNKRRSCHSLYGVARLKDGVAIPTALANMKAIASQLEVQYPESNRSQGAYVVPFSQYVVGDIRPVLFVLLGGSVLLLMIACVNVSALLIVRSENRRREIAVRGALGASRSRLTRQFVTESLVLVAIGELLGLVLAQVGIRILLGLISKDMLAGMPYLQGLGLNLHMLGFAALIGVTATVLFSLAPIISSSALTDLRDGMAENAHTSSGRVWRKLGTKLVVVELAIAVVLLAGGGLLAKSFYQLLHVDLGMQPAHLATVGAIFPEDVFPKDEDLVALQKRLLERTASLPGVESVGFTSRMPVTANGNTTWFRVAGHPYNGEHNEANERAVSADFLKTLKATLLRGRHFSESDDAKSSKVAIINQTLAKQYFPGEDPIGKIIGDTDLSPKSQAQIVGVIDDFKEGALDSEIWPAIYYPYNQSPENYVNLVVRTSKSEAALLPTLVSAIRETDPRIATYQEATMADMITESPAAYLHRSSASLVGGFAAVALLLGVFGLYSVIAYSVSRRTREIGVRMALGAQRSSVYQLILKEAGWLIVIGSALGLVLAVLAAASIRQLLFGVSYWDLSTLGIVVVLLSTAALVASYIPARRAASVNPMEALRAE